MPARARTRFRLYWPALAILAAGLALTAAIGWELHRQAKQIDRKQFALRIEEFTDQLDGRLEKTELLLRQLQDYLMLTGEGNLRIFDEWCSRRGLLFNFPWLYGIVVATNRHHSQWRSEIPQPVSSWRGDEWRKFQQLSRKQPVDCVIALRSHVAQRRRYLDDYDLRGVMPDTSTFALAVKGVHLRISDRRTVMLDAHSNALAGVLMYAPVYEAGVSEFMSVLNWDDPRRSIPRWLHLDSMIAAAIDFRALEQAVWDGKESDLGAELFSSTNQTAETWLNPEPVGPRAADSCYKAYLTHRAPWRMYNRNFSIFFHTTPLFEAHSPKRVARTAMFSGAGITVLASALLGIVIRARSRQERMEAEVLEARDALAAAGKERVKLGHDLHDGAIQSLYAVQLGLTRTAQVVGSAQPSAARVLEETRRRVDEVIAELRLFLLSREKNGTSEPPVGLDRVLATMVQRLQPTTVARLETRLDPAAAVRLSPAQAVQLTQFARTAVANSLRHAQPGRVEITLHQQNDAVRLEIADDGIGFDPDRIRSDGLGLQTMRARATEAGGTFEFETRPGGGTRVMVTIPTPPANFD